MNPIRTIIIASAAYLDPQLEAEFGRIPPSFLPLGGIRLYQHQYRLLNDLNARLILSLPENFILPEHDRRELDYLGVEVLPVPEGLSLGASLVYVMNLAACAGGPVSILHGDTLLRGVDLNRFDAVSIGPNQVGYEWGQVYLAEDNTLLSEVRNGALLDKRLSILTGWFSFHDGFSLIQSITKKSGHFLDGILHYAEKNKLRAVHADEWFDFGHADTYYQSRRRITTQRSFNELQITKRNVVKRGDNTEKISAEASWFEQLPGKLRIHVPAILAYERSKDQTSYTLEYLHLPTLSELFVFGRLPVGAWTKIFNSANEVLTCLSDCSYDTNFIENIGDIYQKKTINRLDQFSRASGVSISDECRLNGFPLPSIERMVEIAGAMIPSATSIHLGLIHGDFCFSNLLYDHRADLIKMIDPRGLSENGKQTIYGDRRYDIAKMYHSVIGRYDHIISGRYQLIKNSQLDYNFILPHDPLLLDIEAEFNLHRFLGFSIEDSSANAICVLLFLSMLPLHSDRPDRQDAFLANAMRLFLMLEVSE